MRENIARASHPQSDIASLKLPPTLKTYHGQRHGDVACEVWIEQREPSGVVRCSLPLHLGIRNHSPTGFQWGYSGSGPAQLALALLVDALGDVELAQQHYQDFKRQVVAGWADSWSITREQIVAFVSNRL